MVGYYKIKSLCYTCGLLAVIEIKGERKSHQVFFFFPFHLPIMTSCEKEITQTPDFFIDQRGTLYVGLIVASSVTNSCCCLSSTLLAY